jgi:three-Cys-motif partner protein
VRKWRGADGLPVRPGGPWTQEKLAYLERYASAFMKAMGPKRAQGKWNRLVYIDLLAGPGRGVDRDTGIEFAAGCGSSPTRVRSAVQR